MLAELEARCAALGSMLADAGRPPDQRLALQEELDKYMRLRQELRDELVGDQGGNLLWMWVSEDDSITRESRRFPQ